MRLVFPEVRKRCSPEEWNARCELAAVFRLAEKFKWTDIIYNHFSVRLPGSKEYFVHALGLSFREVRASNLIKIDCDGNILDNPLGANALLPHTPKGYEIIQGASVVHGGVHLVRPEITCVLHTHNRAGIAVSAMKCGLLPISQHAMVIQKQVTYHDYEGMIVQKGERERVAEKLGTKSKAMILKNHGLLTLGETVAEAFHMMYYLNAACEAQIDAMSGGMDNLDYLQEPLATKTSHDFEYTRSAMIQMEWSALLRQLEHEKIDFAV